MNTRRLRKTACLRHGPSNGFHAFTLLELVSALGLLIVLASIAIPSFYRGFMTHRTLDQSVDKVIEAIFSAKRQAIERSSSVVYEFVQGSNTQVIYSAVKREEKQLYSLPQGVRLDGKPIGSKGTVQILFREDGNTDDAMVVVSHRDLRQEIQIQRHIGIPQRVYTR